MTRSARVFLGNYEENDFSTDFIGLQKRSYEDFLQIGIPVEKRKKVGLEKVFSSFFPLKSRHGTVCLEYRGYSLDGPQYSEDHCQKMGLTYSIPLSLNLRLTILPKEDSVSPNREKNSDDDSSLQIEKCDSEKTERTESEMKPLIHDQDVHVCDIPLINEEGHFIISGISRVIVSQLQRSPGVFFYEDVERMKSMGRKCFSVKIIPYKGIWLDFCFGSKKCLYVRVDKKKKLISTSILVGMGMTRKQIVDALVDSFLCYGPVDSNPNYWKIDFDESQWCDFSPKNDILDVSGDVLFERGSIIRSSGEKKDVFPVLICCDDLINFRFTDDFCTSSDPEKVLFKIGSFFSKEIIDSINSSHFPVSLASYSFVSKSFFSVLDTLLVDSSYTQEEAFNNIYSFLRPGDPLASEYAGSYFESLFCDPSRYDLSDVGRSKINARISNGRDISDSKLLRREDILGTIAHLFDLCRGKGSQDDIDSLSNRRVRTIGELLGNEFFAALTRIEKTVREKMNMCDRSSDISPYSFFHSRSLGTSIRDFFTLSPLSQFMDQVNPLSGLAHKRRLSALGPGGLNRDRAGFETRDVHPSHYGRICPIETPEGPNVGLINSLASHACLDKYGFIITPYRKIVNGKLTGEIVHLSPSEDYQYAIAQAGTCVNQDGVIVDDHILCRKEGSVVTLPRNEIDFMDFSSRQILSVAASLIPFLQNDDANRALMGSNMQRQAIPLLVPDSPAVGTGVEFHVANNSSALVKSSDSGTVFYVDNERIVIGNEGVSAKTYYLKKFKRTNQDTCIMEVPQVKLGDHVESGSYIASGQSIDGNELSLGKNVLVAFMPWRGYNFEDSILISERLVYDDVFTSLHIKKLEVPVRETKTGPEEITKDIPNVSEDVLQNLDSLGIVQVGSYVKPGQILVGKVVRKADSPHSSEERLLKSIFADRSVEVQDVSLYVPPGVQGIVMDVRVLNRVNASKDGRTIEIEKSKIEGIKKSYSEIRTIMDKRFCEKTSSLLEELNDSGSLKKKEYADLCSFLKERNIDKFLNHKCLDEFPILKNLRDPYYRWVSEQEACIKCDIDSVQSGVDLASDLIKVLEVFIAVKKKIQIGDKIAGRHGNKGVISNILPVEDMPFMEDGSPIDMVISPLGVPSRMNIGQILETHLGLVSYSLSKKIKSAYKEYLKDGNKEKMRGVLEFCYDRKVEEDEIETLAQQKVSYAVPVFSRVPESKINSLLEKAGYDSSGQVTLYDGRTGFPFKRKVTVGHKYMLKLNHLVDDKIHARSVGPYSLITQQPLGGKSQLGGQRFGEMEVWGLEAYGAAYTLQEMLTIKSDDVKGRSKAYASIVSGGLSFDSDIPESFNVLIAEMSALCLKVDFLFNE